MRVLDFAPDRGHRVEVVPEPAARRVRLHVIAAGRWPSALVLYAADEASLAVELRRWADALDPPASMSAAAVRAGRRRTR